MDARLIDGWIMKIICEILIFFLASWLCGLSIIFFKDGWMDRTDGCGFQNLKCFLKHKNLIFSSTYYLNNKIIEGFNKCNEKNKIKIKI